MTTKKRAAATSRPRRTPQPSRATLIARAQRAVLGILPLLALMAVVRVALAEPYHIPSPSMEPTLLTGDWLYVNKLRYGPHVPFTSINLPGYAEPKRGDVVVFVSPPQVPEIRITPADVTPTLVKRIVGAGGDTLSMRDGTLFVNGIAEQRSDAMNALSRDPVFSAPQPLLEWQHALEVHGTRFGEPPTAGPSLHQWGPLVVPRGTFFMLGDNRDNSVDSRYYGPVPRANVRGRPMFVYYSYDTQSGHDWVRALTEIRWRRIGDFIR